MPEETQPLKDRIDAIKASLKKRNTFAEAVTELKNVMEKELEYSNKRFFYDALNIVSHRIGKPGFDPQIAKPLFDAADKLSEKFSSGYKKNIKDWKDTVDKMIQNPTEPIRRQDGRFNSVVSTRPPSINRVNQFISSMELFPQILARILTSQSNSSDDDSDSDSPFPGFGFGRRTFFNNYREDYDSEEEDSDNYDDDDDDEAYNLNSKNKSLHFGENYPFFKFLVGDILPPYVVPHKSKPEPYQKSFQLTKSHFEKISKENMKVSFCSFFQNDTTSCKQLPTNVSISINQKLLTTTKAQSINNFHHGYDITSLCKEGLNHVVIKSTSCCCSWKFGIRLVEQTKLESLIENTIANHTVQYDTCFQRVLNSFNNDNELEELSVHISLRCPLGQMRIQTPVRGVECKHIQCFDLNSFLQLNQNHPTFECPVCSSTVLLKDVRVDSFFQSLIKDTTEENDEIEILPNGTWKIPEDRIERKRKRELMEENRPKKQKQNEVIDLTQVGQIL